MSGYTLLTLYSIMNKPYGIVQVCPKKSGMAANVDDILAKASDVMVRIAEAQAEKAALHDRQKTADHAERRSRS